MEQIFNMTDMNIEHLLNDIDKATMEVRDIFDISDKISTFRVAIQDYGYTSPVAMMGADIVGCINACTSFKIDLGESYTNSNKDQIVKGCEELLQQCLDKIETFFKWMWEKIVHLFNEMTDGAKALIVRAEVLLRNLRSRRRIKSYSGTETFVLRDYEDLDKEVYTITKTDFLELEKILKDRFEVILLIENFVKYGGKLTSLMMNGNVDLNRSSFNEALRDATNNRVQMVSTRNSFVNDLIIQRMQKIISPIGGSPSYAVKSTEWESETPMESAAVVCQRFAKQLMGTIKMRNELERLKNDALRDMRKFRGEAPFKDSAYIAEKKQVAKNMVNGTSDALIVFGSLINQIRMIISFILSKLSNLEGFLARHR